jgi:hypothetical protein
MRRLLQDPRHRCDCVWKLTRLTVCASANQERREGFVALRAILATPLRLLAHTCPLMVLYQWRGSRRWFPSCVNVVESRYEVMSFPVQVGRLSDKGHSDVHKLSRVGRLEPGSTPRAMAQSQSQAADADLVAASPRCGHLGFRSASDMHLASI